jgi:hypothetical protein
MNLIKRDIPHLKESDINHLVESLMSISKQKRSSIDNQEDLGDIEQWAPSPKTIKEIIDRRVRIIDVSFCIEDFQQFAKSKGWQVSDNLDAKFIVHVNIMIAKFRIKPVASNEIPAQ